MNTYSGQGSGIGTDIKQRVGFVFKKLMIQDNKLMMIAQYGRYGHTYSGGRHEGFTEVRARQKAAA